MKSKGYNVPDEVVLDSLESLNETSVSPVVVGGIAASLYLYPKHKGTLRKTKDMDTCLCRYLTESEFKKSVLDPILNFICGKDYSPDVKIPHHFYGIEVLPKTSESGPFYISIPRRSRKLYEKMEKRLMREKRNAEEIRIPQRNGTVNVVRPEDIIAPKLIRRKGKDIFDILVLAQTKDIDNDYLKESLTHFGADGELLEDLYKQFLRIAQKI